MSKHEIIPFRGRLPRFTRDESLEIVAYRGRPPRPTPPCDQSGKNLPLDGKNLPPDGPNGAPDGPNGPPESSDLLASLTSEQDYWTAPAGLYASLLQRAADECPGNLEAAVHRLCFYAREYTSQRRFRTWASDFRRKQESETLRVLARMDVNAFFRRYRPRDDGDSEESLVPLLPQPSEPVYA